MLGLLLVHPDQLNAWHYGKAATGLDGASLPYFDLFGVLLIEKVGYQGQILPILITTWVMCHVERWRRARVHNSVQLLIVPIVTIVVSGLLALSAAVITLNHVRALAIGVGGLPAFISIVPQHIPMFMVGMLVAIMVPLDVTFALAGRIRAQLAAA